jgi:hypothetical protein
MTKDKPNDHYTGILLEDLHHKFDTLIEAFVSLRHEVKTKLATKEEIGEVKTDIKIIRTLLTEHSWQLGNHEQQIKRLVARAK